MYLPLFYLLGRTLIVGHQRMYAMIYSKQSFEPFRNERSINELDFLYYVFDEST